MVKPIYVDWTRLNEKQSGIIHKKDIKKLVKVFEIISTDDISFTIETFKNEDGKTIERLCITSIIYADRVIEDDMEKTPPPVLPPDETTSPTGGNNDAILFKILETVNNLKDDVNNLKDNVDNLKEDMNKKFKAMEKKFDKKLKNFEIKIMSHISKEFEKHIKEYHS